MRILLGTILFLVSLSLTAQTPKQVVDSYLNAIGGKAGLEKVKTMKADIKVEANGLVMDGKMAFSYPDKQYTEMNVRGEKIITVINGNEGWMVNPISGSSSPIPMTPEQIRSNQKNLSTERLLNDSEYSLEDLGEKSVKGQNYRVLKVVFNYKGEPSQKRYFNPATNLIDYVEVESPGGGVIFMAYKDYVAVSGVKFPGTILSYTGKDLNTPSMTMNMENIQVNTSIDETLFNKPK